MVRTVVFTEQTRNRRAQPLRLRIERAVPIESHVVRVEHSKRLPRTVLVDDATALEPNAPHTEATERWRQHRRQSH